MKEGLGGRKATHAATEARVHRIAIGEIVGFLKDHAWVLRLHPTHALLPASNSRKSCNQTGLLDGNEHLGVRMFCYRFPAPAPLVPRVQTKTRLESRLCNVNKEVYVHPFDTKKIKSDTL